MVPSALAAETSTPNFSSRWSVSTLLTSRLTLLLPFQHAMAISSAVLTLAASIALSSAVSTRGQGTQPAPNSVVQTTGACGSRKETPRETDARRRRFLLSRRTCLERCSWVWRRLRNLHTHTRTHTRLMRYRRGDAREEREELSVRTSAQTNVGSVRRVNRSPSAPLPAAETRSSPPRSPLPPPLFSGPGTPRGQASPGPPPAARTGAAGSA
mmetsp:Transcript_33501/g.53737  ORF Transcript_33501/g.53737 Transcript_33501/m.53737 type:complete len:212 (+) Transcript_33501:1075-1710(+)